MRTKTAHQPQMRTVLEIVRAELLQRAILVVFAAVIIAGIAIALKSSGFATTLPLLDWLLK